MAASSLAPAGLTVPRPQRCWTLPMDEYTIREGCEEIINAVAELSPLEREKFLPTEAFGQRHNVLLMEAKKLRPKLAARVWPPPVEFAKFRGTMKARSRYTEIAAYARAILDQLRAG